MVLVKSVEVDIGVKGDRESKAKLDDITRRAEELKKAFPDYKLKIDAAAATERLKVFRGQLAEATRPRTAEIKVKVDDSALARLGKAMQGAGGPWWLGPAVLSLPAITTLGGVGAGAAIGLGGAAVAGAGALAAFGAVAKPVLADALKAAKAVEAAQNAYNATVRAGVPLAQAQQQLQLANTKALITYNAALAAGKNPAKALIDYHATLAKNQATYNLAVNQGAANARAYHTQQQAIAKAYAAMSPQQIALSKQLGAMASAWDDVKAALTPVVSGALQPWLLSITDSLKFLAPVVKAVAPVIGDLGRQFDGLVNSTGFAKFVSFIAGTGSAAVGAIGGTLINFLDAAIILLPKFNPLIEKAIGWIANLGPSVLVWASSQKTADHITAFMAWFNKNGPVVGGMLKNIAGALKALAPGLTAGSILELKLISDFFGWVAKLPPSIAKPLAEVAGALLILNKLGIVKVGLSLIGMDAAKAAAGGGAVGLWGKMLPGARLVGGVVTATLVVDAVLKSTPSGKGKNWFDNPFGMPGPKDSKSSGNWLTSWAPYEHLLTKDIPHWWDLMWHNSIDRLNNGINQSDRLLGGWEHNIAHWFDVGRHDIAVIFDGIRHDIAAIWDAIWRGTVSRVSRGVGDVTAWFKSLPGKIKGAFFGLGADLWGIGKRVLNDMLAGLKAVAGSITGGGILGWLAGFAHGVVGIFRTIWHWFSPSSVMYEGGKALMTGLANGIRDHAHLAINQVSAVAGGAVRGIGVIGAEQRFAAGLLGGYGWGQNQMGPLIALWNRESGWNPNAVNPTSGAYGIPQALGHGHPYNLGDWAAQIRWGLNYIFGRYGSPAAAWQHETAFGWYDQGGYLPPGLSLAYNTTGRPEPVGAVRGNTYQINVYVAPGASAETGRQIVAAIRQHEKRSGKGWRTP